MSSILCAHSTSLIPQMKLQFCLGARLILGTSIMSSQICLPVISHNMGFKIDSWHSLKTQPELQPEKNPPEAHVVLLSWGTEVHWECGFFTSKTQKEHFCPQINTLGGTEALIAELCRTCFTSALRTTFCSWFFLPLPKWSGKRY